MGRTAVLHIGLEKTGTTTIQYFLRANRARLATRGDVVPETLGPVTHTRLATMAESGGGAEDDEAGDDAGSMREAFEAELRALPPTAARVLFSSEHLHRRLGTEAEVARLRDILVPYFSDFRVIVYLRRQDRLAASLFSTTIRYGGVWEKRIVPGRRARAEHYYNFEILLGLWSAVFGREQMRVRVFEPARLLERDVLRDYCAAAEIPMEGLKIPETKNPSLSPAALMVLGKLNEAAPRKGAVLLRENFIRTLEQHFNSSQQILPRREAQGFYEMFRESNRVVRDLYLPDYPESLFEEDFGMYPDVATRPEPALGEVLAVFACLWQAQAAERRALEQRVRELERK